ncbi:hypothetical protein NDK47_19620 [Brevibacillus ruminantium]|uniref:Uncharacterized protein n=1 Tax=Brevibacillus ruminantium TaxID=2950604 RepID=A0ABY4WB04_9BACL|nr:hypothetical protein [Brevibacillus ruminantium]USG64348.1 hypothetical protein NDK47_19620 [Brevibacillus ruminantium]
MRKKLIIALWAIAVLMMFTFGWGKERPKVTIQVLLSTPTQSELAAVKAQAAEQRDFRKLEVNLRLDDSKSAVDRKLEIPDLSAIVNRYDQTRVIAGSAFQQNNIGSEAYAIHEQSVIFDATGLDQESIRSIFRSSYVTVSWSSKEGQRSVSEASIGNLMTVQKE